MAASVNSRRASCEEYSPHQLVSSVMRLPLAWRCSASISRSAGRSRARRVDQQQRVIVVAVEQRFERRQVTLWRGVVAQVERVAGANEVRQRVAQRRQALLAQRRQLTVAAEQFVQGHRRRRRPVADDHQPFAAQRMHMAEGFHRREQLMGILDAQQAGALDGSVIGGVQPQLAVEQ